MRNTDMMNEYIEHIKNIKRLTADEEFELAVEMRNGNKKAREQFIEANMYLVIYYCKPYADFGVPYDDLFQEGSIGLIKAVDSYNPIKAVRFRNYAQMVIVQYVERSLPDNLCTLASHSGRGHDIAKIIFAKNKIRRISGDEPTVDELADYCRMTTKAVQDVLRMTTPPLDFEELIDEDDGFCFIERQAYKDDESFESYIESEVARQRIEENFSKLDKRERDVLCMYYGLDGNEPISLQKIGKIFGYPRETIFVIRNKALAKIGGFDKPKKKGPSYRYYYGR